MISVAYTQLLRLGLPFLFIRLALKGFQEPAYRRRWQERLGWTGYPAIQQKKNLWIHAVSVGEVQAALPLIQQIQNTFPEHTLVLTTTTPSGSDHAWRLFHDSVLHTYLPYDLPGPVTRFLQRTRPCLAIFMENEIWPNLYQICSLRNIPIILANARLSPRSWKRYAKIQRFISHILADCTILAQSQLDQSRFLHLGAKAERIQVSGNLKFDMELPPPLLEEGKGLREAIGQKRPVWIAASTHQEEETEILTAHSQLLERLPESLLILAPRHPERFSAVSNVARSRGFQVQQYSHNRPFQFDSNIYIADVMGRLFAFYAASDIAFVGGSLVARGGHNLLEPAALGRPVLTGPHLFNFTEISSLLQDKKALLIVHDAHELAQGLTKLLQEPGFASQMGMQAQEVCAQNKGAVTKVLLTIKALLNN